MAKGTWGQHNNKFFKAYMDKHKALLEQRLNSVCQELAEEILSYVESFKEIEGMPFFTGNLAEGTGLGVYVNGMLNRFIPAHQATEPQYDKAKHITDIWGEEYLQEAISMAYNRFHKGIWVVLFSSVPYAVRVDTKGTVKRRGKNKGMTSTPAGYFSDRIKGKMIATFKSEFAKKFPNVVKQIKI